MAGGHFAVLGRRKTLDTDSLDQMGDLWSEQLNDKDQRFVYRSHWWMTGNKATEPCDPITMWTPNPSLGLPLRDHSFDPPIPLTRPDNDDFRTYFDNTPSGPYRQRPGQHVWTDGSMVTFEDAQLVGAGAVGYAPDFFRLNFNVGGPATSQRGEMAAAARTLDLADPNEPLTIYTDCMSILNAVARWRRGDFQPRMEDEKHQDVLLDLLKYLRRRGAQTHFVWIAAHIGDAGNEMADREANLGTHSEERLWDLDTFPIALHSTASSSFPLLHAATWTPTVDKHAKRFVGQKQAEWLRNFSDARSTDFTLREDNWREILGRVLADPTIPELAIRDLLQA
eukprot:3939014-Rhodomonas_salina.1